MGWLGSACCVCPRSTGSNTLKSFFLTGSMQQRCPGPTRMQWVISIISTTPIQLTAHLCRGEWDYRATLVDLINDRSCMFELSIPPRLINNCVFRHYPSIGNQLGIFRCKFYVGWWAIQLQYPGDIDIDWNTVQVIMITRLHAMYQRSRKVLIFLVVVFLTSQISTGVMNATFSRDISGGKLGL
jgi:hypothetical protein